MSFLLKRQQLVEPINHYLIQSGVDKDGAADSKQSSSLILDGTGPRLTVQLPYLYGLGLDRVNSFNNIVAFSGGIGAYCVFLAQNMGCINHQLEHYFDAVDAESRRVHKLSSGSAFHIIKNYILKKPVFSRLCYMDFFNYVFSSDFLGARLSEIAPNFLPYVALPGLVRPVAVNAENGFDRDQITMAEVMSAGMKIPHIYSESQSSLSKKPITSAYDATYTSGYWPVRQRLSSLDAITVILTMSNNKLSDSACIINVLGGKRPKYSVTYDIVSLLLNIPNKRYKKDLHLAYLD